MEKMSFFLPEQFSQELSKIIGELKRDVLAVLPNCEVEHIGSSAIHGAISKGDLDILVRVDKNSLSGSIQKIEQLGFTIKENTLRTDNLCMLVTSKYCGTDVAIQLIANGSEFENFVKFRDLLNSNPDLVKKYNCLKAACTGIPADEYRAKKSKFIESVLGCSNDKLEAN